MASPQFEFLIPGWLAYTFALVKAWSDIQRHEGPGVASMATFYISASHLVYGLYFAVRISSRTIQSIEIVRMTSGLVSVVVTTKNEQANIERCLESICIQTYEPIEIIVVDNGSTDLTKTIASRFTTNVFDHGPERSSQRNFGMIAKARASLSCMSTLT